MEGPQSALAVIVCGFGGVGKSTLAAFVVQSLDWSSTNFKFCRVAIDEKTPDKISHIIKLQKDIIRDLGGVKSDLRNPDEGRVKIKEALEKKWSLLFIDNVVDKNYIRDLLPKDLSSQEQKTKLRLLITSREEDVKAKLNINCKVHQVRSLSKPASQRLLLETILQGKEVEDKDFDEYSMINEVADACKGVPLLLSVFGEHLRMERDKDSYQEALDVLREGHLDTYRDEDLGTKLMFVYHKIKVVEVREAFLDICMYFHGWEWNLVGDIVDFPNLQDLRRRMLVSKSGSGEVIVHDILRLMGMKDARFTRFLNYKELSDASQDDSDGFGNVKGISLVSDNSIITIQSIELEAMRQSLRVLMLGDWVTLEGPPCHKAFTNLRYLRVGDITAFPFKDPSKLNKLKVFLNKSKPGMNLSHLPPNLKRITHEVPDVECHNFANLSFQNLSFLKSFIVKPRKSVELSEELHLPVSLVDLDLNKCKTLPKYIGHLTALESLILDRCDLECLPQGFGTLKKLKHLSMDYCSKLSFLSEELGMLSSLEVLSMKGCGNLRTLPIRLGGLLSLQKLKLSKCINLLLLPESFGELRIHSLKLHSLVNLQELPNSFGNMVHLKDLKLISCHSLMSLPRSFVQLKTLETLKIIKCTKLSVLPEDFGRLRCLKDMTVEECPLLKELPHGFGALPSLKAFNLRWCDSFVNLPREFTMLTCLEELFLAHLPLMSRIPDGFGNLKNLRFLRLFSCYQLKTLSDDFENLATMERLQIDDCPELEGAMMEKILKLQNCYMVAIDGKLTEKWRYMQGEKEHLMILVYNGQQQQDKEEERERAIRVALFHGKCMEVNNVTHQLMERSLLLVLEEGITAMVALILLPIHLESHQHQTLQRFVKMSRETAQTNGCSKLQFVCARKVDLDAERLTPTEENERAEEEIRKILLTLPKGSCAIPSSECKRVKILTYCCNSYVGVDKLEFFMADLRVDMEGRKVFENLKFTTEDEIAGKMVTDPSPSEIRMTKNKHDNSIRNFIRSICPEGVRQSQSQSQCVEGESKTRELMKVLKGNGIHYLLIPNNTRTVLVDDLHGKEIGFIICDFKYLEWIKMQQIYKEIQQKDSNFIGIWIPIEWPEDCGYGTYTRLIQCMPWATFPHPQLVSVDSREACLVILDKYGQIANHDALPLLTGWGVKSYPFTQHTIPESFFLESESCLEFLLHGMNIVGRKPMRSKITFLYAERPGEWLQMKCKLEELTQIYGCFEVLYVGKFSIGYQDVIYDIEYEDATQNMSWPSLSFSDMRMFWYRCKYLKKSYKLQKEANRMMETIHGLAIRLDNFKASLVLVENDGAVTSGGYDVLQMICESSDEMAMRMVKEEVMISLSRGECTPLVKTFFRDENDNLPQHPQHRIISYSTSYWDYVCNVCSCLIIGDDGSRTYKCARCQWAMCGRCWMAYAKQQVEQLVCAKVDLSV